MVSFDTGRPPAGLLNAIAAHARRSSTHKAGVTGTNTLRRVQLAAADRVGRDQATSAFIHARPRQRFNAAARSARGLPGLLPKPFHWHGLNARRRSDRRYLRQLSSARPCTIQIAIIISLKMLVGITSASTVNGRNTRRVLRWRATWEAFSHRYRAGPIKSRFASHLIAFGQWLTGATGYKHIAPTLRNSPFTQPASVAHLTPNGMRTSSKWQPHPSSKRSRARLTI